MSEPVQEDTRGAARPARVDCYFQEHLLDHRGWYSRKASAYRWRAQTLSLVVLVAAGLTTFVQIFQATEGANIVPAPG